MAGVERRAALGEIRVEGRRLSGVVMKYGEISPTHRERFEPGSLRMADAVHLDLGHDKERAIAWLPGGGLELREEDGAMLLSALLPPIPAANRALEEIRAGKTTGLSVEFQAVKEGRDGNVRVISEALLTGVGLVAQPSYTGSRIEARSRKNGRLPRWL